MATSNPVPSHRLTRTEDGLTGVGGGIAEYLGLDPVLVRFGIVAGSILTFPLLPIAYVTAWLVIPRKGPPAPPPPRRSDRVNPDDIRDAVVAMAQARAEVEAIDRSAPAPR